MLPAAWVKNCCDKWQLNTYSLDVTVWFQSSPDSRSNPRTLLLGQCLEPQAQGPWSCRTCNIAMPDTWPDSLESLLPRSVGTTLAQLCSGHCRFLNSYKARITSGISDDCLECGLAPHFIEHLFNCQSHPTQLTVQDLWDNPAAVADFLNLDNWR